MRIISQDGTMDLPYENVSLEISDSYDGKCYINWRGDYLTPLGEYPTERAKEVMQMIRNHYSNYKKCQFLTCTDEFPLNEVEKVLYFRMPEE